MEVHGGIDCAARVGRDDGQSLYHLILTEDSVIIAKVLVRKEELKKVEDRIRTKTTSVVTWSANAMAKAVQMEFFEEAWDRGRKIEKDLEAYMESRPDEIEVLDYSRISRVDLSKGTMFGPPFLKFILLNKEIRFNLVHNIFEKAGKLDDNVYLYYLKSLKKAFGNKLKIKV